MLGTFLQYPFVQNDTYDILGVCPYIVYVYKCTYTINTLIMCIHVYMYTCIHVHMCVYIHSYMHVH